MMPNDRYAEIREFAKELRGWADCDARAGEPLGVRMRLAADKLEKLAATLAEKDKEIAALREERDFLQEILDARPAINAALPESYIRWSQSLYSGEAARASLEARNEGGNDDND